jgi:hypothetical protein
MAETPPGGPSYGQSASGFPGAPGQFSGAPGGPPSWPLSAPRGASRALTYISLGISVIATVLAIVGWFRPTHTAAPAAGPSGGPTYTEQQISDAKTKACAAFDIVQKSVRLQTGATNPADNSGDNPALTEAQSANARLSAVAGAIYLRDHVDPATPKEVADAVRELSQSMFDLGEKYLAGGQNADPEITKLRSDGSASATHITELCR